MSRVSVSEKVPEPDINEIIEPLVFEATGNAVTYGLQWSSTTKIDGKVGWWRSNQGTRTWKDKWKELVKRKKEERAAEGKYVWLNNSYYFSHEEGQEALSKYLVEVLQGRTRANQATWFNKGYDKRTGVTFNELAYRYPELYKKRTKVLESKVQAEEVQQEELDFQEVSIDQEDFTDRGILEMEGPEDEQIVVAEETETWFSQQVSLKEDVTTITVQRELATRERASEDILVVQHKEDQKDHQHAQVYIPDLGRTMFLEEGEYEINGVRVRVEITD